MPIYEYECPNCKINLELLTKMNEKLKPKCDNCGNVMHKIMSMNTFKLKGSGWYATDYKNNNPKNGDKK